MYAIGSTKFPRRNLNKAFSLFSRSAKVYSLFPLYKFTNTHTHYSQQRAPAANKPGSLNYVL